MDFPLMIRIGDVGVGAHALFEAASYAIAFAVYRSGRRRAGDVVDDTTRLGTIAAAAVGAALGSWALGWLHAPDGFVEALSDPRLLLTRKTIVGALLGGLLCVELFKWRRRVRRRTGDLFAVPLCVGIAVGRLGCLSAGVHDGTHGLPTDLAWGIDWGDGVARHPVRLVEIAFLIALAVAVARARPVREGDRFRVFMVAYLGFRLVVDALKPADVHLGLSAIQWAALLGLLYYARDVPRLCRAYEIGRAYQRPER